MHGGSVQNRLAALEGAEAALVLASGMAAISSTMLALLRAGDHLVASAWLFGETRRFFEQELPSLGIDVTFVDPTETRGWRRMTRHNTRLFFLASPVDPTTRVVDLNPPRLLAQELGIALVVDSTCASPINFRPLEHGADVVIHSSAMYLLGDHGVQTGVVCGADALIEEVRARMASWGHAPNDAAVALLERDLQTMEIRVQRQNTNAMQVAQWAESHAAVRRVYYPGLRSHPDHDIASTLLNGFGSLVVLDLVEGAASAARLANALTLFRRTPHLGGVDSRVHTLWHAIEHELSARPSADLSLVLGDGAVRLSIGLEDPADLIADLTQALG
jgi:cystathionine beta-lyase/cystathionine gamma-synthase